MNIAHRYNAEVLSKLQPDETKEAAMKNALLQGLKAGNISDDVLLQLRLPKSLHELIPFTPSELYVIDRTPAQRLADEGFEDYKTRMRLKRKIDRKRDVLRGMEMLPYSEKEYLAIAETAGAAETATDAQ